MIVVLDSGVWISALHFGGTPLLALDNAYMHDEIAVCEQIEAEIGECWPVSSGGSKWSWISHSPATYPGLRV